MSSALHAAAKTGDIDAFVDSLLNEPSGKKINAVDEKTLDTPLLTAATYGHANIIKYLLDQPGLNISYQHPKSGQNALHRAAAGNHLSVIKVLTSSPLRKMPLFDTFLNATASSHNSTNTEDDNTRQHQQPQVFTPLQLAIQNGHDAVALHLLSLTPFIKVVLPSSTTKTTTSSTPLLLPHLILSSFSSFSEQEETEAIATISDPEERQHHLHQLLVKKQNTCSKLLDQVFQISKSAEINSIDEQTGFAPIHAAITQNNIPALRTLVCNGADLQVKTKADRKTAAELIRDLGSGEDMMRALVTPPLPFERLFYGGGGGGGGNSSSMMMRSPSSSSSRQRNITVGDVFRALPPSGFVHLMELCDATLLLSEEENDTNGTSSASSSSHLSSDEKIDLALYVENLCQNEKNGEGGEEQEEEEDADNDSAAMMMTNNRERIIKTIKYFVKTLLTNQNDFSLLHPARARCGKEGISDEALDEAIYVASLVQMVTKIAQGHGIEKSNLFHEVLCSSSSSEDGRDHDEEEEWSSFVDYACVKLKLIAAGDNNQHQQHQQGANKDDDDTNSNDDEGGMIIRMSTGSPSMVFVNTSSNNNNRNANDDGDDDEDEQNPDANVVATNDRIRKLQETISELREDVDTIRVQFVLDNLVRGELTKRTAIQNQESKERIERIMSAFQKGLLKMLMANKNVASSGQQKQKQQQQRPSSSRSVASSSRASAIEADRDILRDLFVQTNFFRREDHSRSEVELEQVVARKEIESRSILENPSSSSHQKSSSANHQKNRELAVISVQPTKPSTPQTARAPFQRGRARLVGTQLVVDPCCDISSPLLPTPSPNQQQQQQASSTARGEKSSPESYSPRDDNRYHVEASRVSNQILNVKELLSAEAISEEGLRLQFEALDRNNSGVLEKDEFKKFYTEDLDDFGLEISEWEFEQLWWKICGKKMKTLDFKRFALFMLKRVQM